MASSELWGKLKSCRNIMCSCLDFIEVTILSILIRIWLATDVGYANPFKTTDATQVTRALVMEGRESLITIPRPATSDRENGTTAQPNRKESDNVGAESSSQYENEIESSNPFNPFSLDPFSMDSQELKPEKSNKTEPGLNKLLKFLRDNKYNKYEIQKLNYSRTHLFNYGSMIEQPVDVRMYLSIRSVSDIDETNESVSLEVDIITQWRDGKLQEWFFSSDEELQREYRQAWPEARNFVPLESKVLQNFWLPDIYIRGLSKVTTSNILSKSERLKFRREGFFIYIKRVTLKVKCEMDFTYYPADTQKCHFLLRSYSYNSSDLNLTWRKPEGVYLMETSDPNFDLQVVNVTRYNILERAKKECVDDSENPALRKCYGLDPEEEFHVLRFTLHMRRKIYYHLLQTYIPSALYIAITWLCFMIPRRMVEGRIAISMTTILTLTASFASVRESTPKVSYIKAIDIWMAAGIVFVFLNLLEFAILLWSEAAKKDGKRLEESGQESSGSDEECGSQQAAETKKTMAKQYVTFRQKLREWVHSKATIVIDFIEDNSFESILIVTTCFCIAYWTWLFVKSGYFSWRLDDEHNANAGYNKYEEKMGSLLPNYQ